MQIVIPCFLGGVVWILLLLLVIWSIRRAFRPAPGAFVGDGSFHDRGSGEVMLGSYKIKFSYSPPRRVKNGIVKRKLKISLDKISPIALYLYAQTQTDEWLFRYGFAHELVLGIPWLDRQFNISTSDESATRKFLGRDDIQNLLRQLISPAFVSFSIEPKAYSMVLEDFDPHNYQDLNQMVLSLGQKLSEFFPAVHENFLSSSMQKAVKLARVHGILQSPGFTGVLFIILILIYIGLIILYRTYEPLHGLDTFFLFSASALGIVATLLFLGRPFFKNVSLPGREIKGVAALFLVSMWITIFASLTLMNVKWDRSPVQKVSERILTKWISHSGRGNTRHYLINFEAPTPAHIGLHKDIVESELSYQEWQKVNPGKDFIFLELREGYLGAPWIQAHWFGEKNNWTQ